ncbi:MAG: hypothetical protein V1656_00890 [Candidatus Jorgensenbacteria bacterium]
MEKKRDGQALQRCSGQALRRYSGQAMLLTVVMTGGILFLVTSVAGILMFYQLQEMTDIGNSAAALFAADAILEKATYEYRTTSAFAYDPATPCFANPPCPGPSLQLSNGASGVSYLTIPVPGAMKPVTVITAEGRGPGGRTIRLLQTKFSIGL